jgi:hypothetical protein
MPPETFTLPLDLSEMTSCTMTLDPGATLLGGFADVVVTHVEEIKLAYGPRPTRGRIRHHFSLSSSAIAALG